ncbi:MAG: hypothetical protein GXP21_06855 [Gammaproteobacteria bacterium]|nr:hypothetical protein [Gammaproteobacteria bacterium]
MSLDEKLAGIDIHLVVEANKHAAATSLHTLYTNPPKGSAIHHVTAYLAENTAPIILVTQFIMLFDGLGSRTLMRPIKLN